MAKKVRRKERPTGTLKQPRQVADPNRYKTLSLSWKLSAIDLSGKWGWSGITSRSLLVITQRLKELENKSLYELEQCGSHEMLCSALCGEAQQRLQEIKMDDTDSLFSFRIGKRIRIWGILDGNVVTVLWHDPRHEVYPMNIADN